MTLGRIVIASLLCLITATSATAHSLNLFVREEAGAVKGSAYFTGGTARSFVTTTQARSAWNRCISTSRCRSSGSVRR